MSKSYKLNDVAGIEKQIAAAHNLGQRAQDAYQKAAVSVIMHSLLSSAHNHSAGLCGKLVFGMPDMARQDAMIAFVEHYGNFAFNKAENKIEWFKNGTITLPVTAAYAGTLPAWQDSTRKPTPKSVYDVAEELQRLLGKIEKAQKKGLEVQHADIIPQLRIALRDAASEVSDAVGMPPTAANLKAA